MINTQDLYLIGCASGLAGADINSGQGPLVIQQSSFLAELLTKNLRIHWDKMIYPSAGKNLNDILHELYEKLATEVSKLLKQQKKPCVVGGDHSCAIGTWSGFYHALHSQGDIGLIWIDAHMDSHTPETSESGRIHGMPLACLLGYGFSSLTNILNSAPKIKPQNLCLIGVRSFESGEADLLKKLNVRVYFMDEVRERGLKIVLQEAVNRVRKQTIGYGLSIDLDVIDPPDAPGVDVPEPDGISAKLMLDSLQEIVNDPHLMLTEIVEFDPKRDKDNITEKLFINFLEILAQRKF